MSFWEKLFDNKNTVLAVGGGLAFAATLGILYKNYIDENSEENNFEEPNLYGNFDIDKEIQKIKEQINVANPSLEDVKKILSFSLEASKIQIFKYSKQFKAERKKYNKQSRDENLSEYLKMVAKGMAKIQEIGVRLQQQIMGKFGINESVFQKYATQLGPFMQQQMMEQGIGMNTNKELNVNDVKKAINLQVEYIRSHGSTLAQKIGSACSNWPQQEKASVPTLLSVYIADEVFENYPEIDEDDLQGAEMKFQAQLQNQMMQLQGAMGPMMQELYQNLGMGGGMGMGGMGGMGMDPMAGGMDPMMGGMDPMGGMGGITMEQLEQIRMQDPAAFEQMMQMMGGMR